MKRFSCPAFIILFLLLPFTFLHAADKQFVVNIGPDGIQKFEIVGGSYFFKPDHVAVKAHIPVEISIRKEGGLIPHDFVLNAPEAGMDFRVDLSSEPRIIRFTPTKPGKYEFRCDKKSPFSSETHADKGMKGILEVVP
ncbi:MAG: cupredoxin domain-containing protein [Syntrophaceae bacterium]